MTRSFASVFPVLLAASVAVSLSTKPLLAQTTTSDRYTPVIDTSVDDHVFALDTATGDMVWETEILDYDTDRALQSSGPIIANEHRTH